MAPPKSRQRQALVWAAAKLFRRQGYSGTGLRDILAASGAARGSLYHHFPGGKEEIGAAAVTAAGGLVTAPSTADLDSPIGDDVRLYMQSAGADAETRVHLMRLAFDATLSGFSGRQLLYERYFGGDPVRNAHRHVAGYDKQPLMDKVLSFLERCAAEETDFKKHAGE